MTIGQWVPMQTTGTTLQIIYVSLFALGAVGCGFAVIRARRLTHRDTRVGLVGLLVLSGLWAGSTSVRLLSMDPTISRALHLFELTVGLATVGAWLYFASAYTGETYHQQPTIRRWAAGGFLALIAVKLTNPLHGVYLRTHFKPTPFPHLVITDFGLHLAIMTFSYALAALGFYMLFQLFLGSKASTKPLVGVVGLAALPVLGNVAGQLGIVGVLQLSYEPLGVAAFAIGTLYFAETTFEKARWTRHQRVLDQLDEAIILVDTDNHIRDFNNTAATLFPDLTSAIGTPLTGVAPAVVEALETIESNEGAAAPKTITLTRRGEERYYLPAATTISYGSHTSGRVIVCTDVTKVERQRRELHRQNDQLDGVAAAIAHELRNTLAIVYGRVALVANAVAHSEDNKTIDNINIAMDTLDRMEHIINDLTISARYAKIVEETESFDIQERLSYIVLPEVGGDVTIRFENTGQIEADASRLEELIRQAARLTAQTGGRTLTIEVDEQTMTLTTDGDQVPEGSKDDLFRYGTAVPHARAGMLGPNIQALARAHGWDVLLDEDYQDGIRIHITGMEIRTTGVDVEPQDT